MQLFNGILFEIIFYLVNVVTIMLCWLFLGDISPTLIVFPKSENQKYMTLTMSSIALFGVVVTLGGLIKSCFVLKPLSELSKEKYEFEDFVVMD